MNVVKNGEWVTPVHGGYLMQCCDCGLIHRIDFRVLRKIKKKCRQVRFATQGAAYKVQFRAYRK